MSSRLLQILAEIKVSSEDINLPKGDVKQETIANGLQLVFGLAGAIAVVIITIAALQYVLSQGNPQATAKAKDTILYAVIGLVICAFAFVIVKFVVLQVTT